MRFRERLGLSVPPILLRLTLAAAFLWSGFGKMTVIDFGPEQASTLASLGVDVQRPSGAAPPADGQNGDDAANGGAQSAATRSAGSAAVEGYPDARFVLAQDTQPQPDQPEEPSEERQPGETDETQEQPAGGEEAQPAETEAGPESEDESAPAEAQPPAFPDGGRALALHRVTLIVHGASSTSGGGTPLLPAAVNASPWPTVLGWAAAITELAGAGFVLGGLLTRLWALGLASVMAMAMWLTQVGPVVLGGQPGFLGFLPPPENMDAWTTLLLQLALMVCGLSLVFLGGGPLSLDRLLFGGSRVEDVDLSDPGD